jgi:DNA polymerase-4
VDRTILHSDYEQLCYASIELLHHPETTRKTLAVGGDPEARHGIVLAKDQLAKKAGVQTEEWPYGSQAGLPQHHILPPRMDCTCAFSKLAHEYYDEYTDQQEEFGIDESWLDVTGSCSCKGDGLNHRKRNQQPG